MGRITRFFNQVDSVRFGLWEWDIALSPGLIALLILGLGYGIYRAIKIHPKFSWNKATAILCLCLGTWLATDLTLGQGWLYNLVKPLPVLRSLHVNVRFTSVFIFPLALLGALVFHLLFKEGKWIKTAAAIFVGLSTLAMLSLYLTIPEDVHIRNFNINSALPTYAQLDKGWNFTLQNVARITDMQVFRQEDSNLAFMDPMFGYSGEYFTPKAVIGPILAVNNGYYNLTNPAGYVFPKENNLQPFDLFRVDQKADLELLINHRQPRLAISNWQKFADVVSLLTLVASVLYLLFMSIKESKRIWHMNVR